MKKSDTILTSIFILLCCVFTNPAIAWDDKLTHKDLSLFAVENSVLSKNKGDFLKNLGFEQGVKEPVKWNINKTTLDWFREGAELEDEGSNWQGFTGAARYTNHFHNPLKPWSMAGLTDLQSGESTVLWAQDSNNQSTSVGGDWSWKTIRDHFYKALTLTTDAERQAHFAQTFRGLGHQMHLIQDMSVPAHTRNDAHPLDSVAKINYKTGDYYLETWAKKKYSIINSFASSPSVPQVALNVNHNGLLPIAQFIDSEQYGGMMPSTSLTWGLSEYTNSNFLSDDTIFTENRDINDKHYFPYPRYSSNSYSMYEIDQSLITKRIYLKKINDGEQVEHFASYGPLFKWLTFDPLLQKSELKLNPAVFKDYASKLIPRAVGYSAGLLNYFFRGDIDMAPDTTGSGYVITNNSDEDMNGIFEIWYDNTSDQRVKAWSGSFPVGRKSSGNNKSTNITFMTPSDAKEQNKYMLVFTGKLGSESGSVIGKQINMKAFPRGGIISGTQGYYSTSVIIFDGAQTKTFYIDLPDHSERILKAAFDEGTVDTVRVLSNRFDTDKMVWKFHTFVYDNSTATYKEESLSEALSANYFPPPVESDFVYTREKAVSYPSYVGNEKYTYSGLVYETSYEWPSLNDFFVPANSAPIFLKTKDKNVDIAKYTTKYNVFTTYKEYNYMYGKECSGTDNYNEEYIEGSLNDDPLCKAYGSYTDSCKGDSSWERTGYLSEIDAYDIGPSEWLECSSGNDIGYEYTNSLSIWLFNLLEYGEFSKKVINPEYSGSDHVWATGDSGLCTLFSDAAMAEAGPTLAGKIISDSKMVLKVSNIPDGSLYSLEPDGTSLERSPSLILRQSSGYSMLEYLGNGKFRNHTNLTNLSPEKPVLLNREFNGFKVSYESNYNGDPWRPYVKIQVGRNFDFSTQEFSAVGTASFAAGADWIMDMMVEYQK